MAEPADTICIVIGYGGTSGVGTSNVGSFGNVGLSCSTALSGSPSLLHNFLKLFPLLSILALPENEMKKLRSEKKLYLARLSRHGPYFSSSMLG